MGGEGFVSWSIRPNIGGAVIPSALLTGKYYTAHLAPLMSHKFWTVTTNPHIYRMASLTETGPSQGGNFVLGDTNYKNMNLNSRKWKL